MCIEVPVRSRQSSNSNNVAPFTGSGGRGANLDYSARVKGGQSSAAQNRRDGNGRFLPSKSKGRMSLAA